MESYYNIGEEKYIDGVYGRLVNGRFYTHVLENNDNQLLRKLDMASKEEFFIIRTALSQDESIFKQYKGAILVPYKPKHIKDCEKLEYGDFVWFECLGNYYSSRFVGMCGQGFVVCSIFNKQGEHLPECTKIVDKVFLKPPFKLS